MHAAEAAGFGKVRHVDAGHVFLDLRFGPDYRFLRARGLDTGRLNLYRLAMHLSLVARAIAAARRGLSRA